MTLNEKIGAEITTAMKAKDATRLSALRMLKAAVMNKGVEKGRDLEDAEVLQVISSLVKQRRDSIEQFSKAGRADLVEKETAEIAVLERLKVTGFLGDEIGASGVGKLLDRIAALLDQRGDHLQHFRIVEIAPLLDALVHDRRLEHPQGGETRRILRLHRG